MSAYVYFLTCGDGSIYTGWTTDLTKRVETHNLGRGAKYTRARLPVLLSYAEEHENRSEAQKREYYLRNLSREEKLKRIDEFTSRQTTKE